jgi:DNA modification methylase
LDPFLGTGSTSAAAISADRNSIGNELDPAYFNMARERLMSLVKQDRMFGPSPSLIVS